jgi:hypothetical protein
MSTRPRLASRVRKNAGSLWLFSEGVQVAAAQTVTLGPRIGSLPRPLARERPLSLGRHRHAKLLNDAVRPEIC